MFKFVFFLATCSICVICISYPNQIIIARDYYTWRKSLTAYDENCRSFAEVKKICSSWHNDVKVMDNGDMIAHTDDHRLPGQDEVITVTSVLTGYQVKVIYGFYDRIKSIITLGGDVSMLIFNASGEGVGDSSKYGKLVATLDGTGFLNNQMTINDLNGNLMYYATDNKYNFEINPCRSENKLAHGFYTINATAISNPVLGEEVFLALMSNLILNFSDNKTDSCTAWTIYGRWVLLALCLLIGIIAVIAFIKFGGVNWTLERLNRFSFIKSKITGSYSFGSDSKEKEKEAKDEDWKKYQSPPPIPGSSELESQATTEVLVDDSTKTVNIELTEEDILQRDAL